MEIELKKTLIALFATASVFAGVSVASADTSTADLTVKATLSNGCGIRFDDATIDFGKIYDLSTIDKRTSHFQVKCTSALVGPDGKSDPNNYTPQSVALDDGGSGDTANRLLYNTSYTGVKNTLKFQVYQSAQASGKVWGEKTVNDPATPSYPIDNAYSNTSYPFTVALLNQDITGYTIGQYSAVMRATLTYTAGPAPKGN